MRRLPHVVMEKERFSSDYGAFDHIDKDGLTAGLVCLDASRSESVDRVTTHQLTYLKITGEEFFTTGSKQVIDLRPPATEASDDDGDVSFINRHKSATTRAAEQATVTPGEFPALADLDLLSMWLEEQLEESSDPVARMIAQDLDQFSKQKDILIDEDSSGESSVDSEDIAIPPPPLLRRFLAGDSDGSVPLAEAWSVLEDEEDPAEVRRLLGLSFAADGSIQFGDRKLGKLYWLWGTTLSGQCNAHKACRNLVTASAVRASHVESDIYKWLAVGTSMNKVDHIEVESRERPSFP